MSSNPDCPALGFGLVLWAKIAIRQNVHVSPNSGGFLEFYHYAEIPLRYLHVIQMSMSH